MATTDENRKYNEGRRQRGDIRGPWISAEAREALRALCYHQNRKPCEVVSALIEEAWRSVGAPDETVDSVMRKHGLSECEAREFMGRNHAQ